MFANAEVQFQGSSRNMGISSMHGVCVERFLKVVLERWMYLNQERLLKYIPSCSLSEVAGPSSLIKVYNGKKEGEFCSIFYQCRTPRALWLSPTGLPPSGLSGILCPSFVYCVLLGLV